jgi:uncharacterized membrane protein/nitrite reductase/ring-hydroxylating ferredoxin subunit
MRAKANIKGHPIHPMLIPFPIAFLTGAFVCDVIGGWLNHAQWFTTGAYLAFAGIVAGLIAAVPGVVDYAYAVPPSSSAKKRATYHMAVNTGAIALFVIAWIYRGGPTTRPDGTVMTLEGAGIALMVIGGWLGGTLVYRNFVGPEQRYANAGKWNEATFEQPAHNEPIAVADEDELEVDQMKLLRIKDKRIVLARTPQGYVAFEDRCSHRGGSLAGGVMMCDKVQCLWHGSQFNVHSGAVESGPATNAISTFKLEQRDGKINLLL